MNFVRRAVIFLLVLFLIVTAAQFGATYYFFRPDREITPAELLAVFPGEKQRLLAGCDLAAEGFASKLMVVSLSAEKLAEICSNHNTQAGLEVMTISSGKSRSTFEDVYNTLAAIDQHGITSIILVTSAYHLPRAGFLLKTSLFLEGRHVAVQLYPADKKWAPRENLRLYFNEIAKLFGSTAEMAWYFSTGRLLLDSPQFRETRTFLKKHLLIFSTKTQAATASPSTATNQLRLSGYGKSPVAEDTQ